MGRELITSRFLLNRQRLYGAAYRRLHSPGDAEDVLQEVFLKAWLHADALANEEACDAWLMRICINASVDVQRKRLRRRETLTGELWSAQEEDPLGRLWLRLLLEGLDKDSRQSLLGYYFGGLSVNEVAQRLARPEGTVKAMLYRARQQLKAALTD